METGEGKKEQERFSRFHSMLEMIRAIERGELPERVMFTFHPQRWTDNPAAWAEELVWQGVKNGVKKRMVGSRRKGEGEKEAGVGRLEAGKERQGEGDRQKS